MSPIDPEASYYLPNSSSFDVSILHSVVNIIVSKVNANNLQNPTKSLRTILKSRRDTQTNKGPLSVTNENYAIS